MLVEINTITKEPQNRGSLLPDCRYVVNVLLEAVKEGIDNEESAFFGCNLGYKYLTPSLKQWLTRISNLEFSKYKTKAIVEWAMGKNVLAKIFSWIYRYAKRQGIRGSRRLHRSYKMGNEDVCSPSRNAVTVISYWDRTQKWKGCGPSENMYRLTKGRQWHQSSSNAWCYWRLTNTFGIRI